MVNGPVQRVACGCPRALLYIVEGCLVGGDHAEPGAGLNREVAQGHPAFHGERTDAAASKLDGVAAREIGAKGGDDGQGQVFRTNPGAERTIDSHAQAFGLFLPNRLGCQNMGHLGGTDAEGERTKRAMGRGVAVATIDQQARQGQAKFWTNDMHDPLARIIKPETFDAMRSAILLQCFDHPGILGIECCRAGGRVMIGNAKSEPGLGHFHVALREFGESVMRAFMHQVAVDP